MLCDTVFTVTSPVEGSSVFMRRRMTAKNMYRTDATIPRTTSTRRNWQTNLRMRKANSQRCSVLRTVAMRRRFAADFAAGSGMDSTGMIGEEDALESKRLHGQKA